MIQEAIIDSDEFDLISFVESFHTYSNLNAMFLFDSHSYCLFRFDGVTGKGGGVAIYAKSSLRLIRMFCNLSTFVCYYSI